MTVSKGKPRVLTNLRIDEISSVDKGAGENVRVLLMKRDDRNAAFARLMRKIFGVKPFNPRKNLDVVADPRKPIGALPGDDEVYDVDDRLATEMDTDNDDEATDNEEEPQMKRAEELSEIGKKFGVNAICKRVVEKNDLPLSEHELVSMMSDHAERNGTSFAKAFTSQTEEGVLWRKAIEACKHRAWINASGAR